MVSAMPCNSRKTSGKSSLRTHKTRYAMSNEQGEVLCKDQCFCEAHESTRRRIYETQNRDHEDHIAEKVYRSLSHYNLVHKLFPVPQAMKIPDAQAAVDPKWETLTNLSAWQESTVKSK